MILTGAGDRAFSAGTDLSELIQVSADEARTVAKRGQQLCNQIEQTPVPVIAAINGIAAGGGCELALACHLRIATPNAEFSLPETKLGIIPGYGGTQRLMRELGRARALELLLTSGRINTTDALRLGLINRIVDASELLKAAEALAQEIAQLAPLAIRACLQAVVQGTNCHWKRAWRWKRNSSPACLLPMTCAKAHAPFLKNADLFSKVSRIDIPVCPDRCFPSLRKSKFTITHLTFFHLPFRFAFFIALNFHSRISMTNERCHMMNEKSTFLFQLALRSPKIGQEGIPVLSELTACRSQCRPLYSK